MLALLVLLNKTGQSYLQSLRRDLAKGGFESILLVASISWVGLALLLGLIAAGRFQLPTDPLFYLYWLALALITVTQFILFLSGLIKSGFFAASAFSHLGFVIVIGYAVLFLNESVGAAHVFSLIIALFGALCFLDWKKTFKSLYRNNTGLILILFSLLIEPLGLIFYKSAISHTSSYDQFLTGRLTLDAAYYSLFLLVLYRFWYKKDPLQTAYSFVSSQKGFVFMLGSAGLNLLDSWLIYRLPLVEFTILGTISVLTGYVIGQLKYRETVRPRLVVGGLLIMIAVAVFAMHSFEISALSQTVALPRQVP